MGFPAPFAELLLRENQREPFRGRILILGKQSILLSPATFSALLTKYGISFRAEVEIDVATATSVECKEPLITDAIFFQALGLDPSQIDVMDVSDYEGANITHDLNSPVPSQYRSQYDCIIDGSVFDNIFDPVTALKNVAGMLKPEGRVIMLEMATNFAFPFLVFSPEWFYDFFVFNGFKQCAVFSGLFDEKQNLLYGPWHLHRYNSGCSGKEMIYIPDIAPQKAVQIIVAKKASISTEEKIPCQSVYRGTNEAGIFSEIEKAVPPEYFGVHLPTTGKEGWLFCETVGTAPDVGFKESCVPAKPVYGIYITEATYGWNCRGSVNINPGNVTGVIGQKCNSRKNIEFQIDVAELGDPAPGRTKC